MAILIACKFSGNR